MTEALGPLLHLSSCLYIDSILAEGKVNQSSLSSLFGSRGWIPPQAPCLLGGSGGGLPPPSSIFFVANVMEGMGRREGGGDPRPPPTPLSFSYHTSLPLQGAGAGEPECCGCSLLPSVARPLRGVVTKALPWTLSAPHNVHRPCVLGGPSDRFRRCALRYVGPPGQSTLQLSRIFRGFFFFNFYIRNIYVSSDSGNEYRANLFCAFVALCFSPVILRCKPEGVSLQAGRAHIFLKGIYNWSICTIVSEAYLLGANPNLCQVGLLILRLLSSDAQANVGFRAGRGA